MKKPFLWIDTLSSALHDSLNSVVSYELRSTAGDICSRTQSRQRRSGQTPANSVRQEINGTASRDGRKVA